ncbi:MAG: TetR/AcrR family transcriptional regulator [Verrucomicrobiota bacterium]
MPRRDLTDERTSQILDALERCILKNGLQASSLEKVAEEAGVKRPIIRHYIGNREDLLLALTQRFVGRDRERGLVMVRALGETNRVEALLDTLFCSSNQTDAESILIYEELILAAARIETIRELISRSTATFVNLIAKELRAEYPDSRGHTEVAWGVASIFYNQISLQALRLPPRLVGSSRAAAQRLVHSLRL